MELIHMLCKEAADLTEKSIVDKLKIYMLQEEAEAHWTKQRMGDQI